MRLWAIGTVFSVVMLGAIGCSQLSEDEIAKLIEAKVENRVDGLESDVDDLEDTVDKLEDALFGYSGIPYGDTYVIFDLQSAVDDLESSVYVLRDCLYRLVRNRSHRSYCP